MFVHVSESKKGRPQDSERERERGRECVREGERA